MSVFLVFRVFGLAAVAGDFLDFGFVACDEVDSGFGGAAEAGLFFHYSYLNGKCW